jgi:hypothetical protein
MSTYSLTLINKPFRLIEPELCKLLRADTVPAGEADEDGNLRIHESADGWTMLDDRDSLTVTASVPEIADLLLKLSATTDSQIRSITCQTNAVYTHIFVAESGSLLRRYEHCESTTVDEGELAAWDEQIRRDPWSAAEQLVGMDPTGSIKSAADAPPFSSDLSQPFTRPLQFAPSELAIPTRQLRPQMLAVHRALAEGDVLVAELVEGSPRRLVTADVDEVFQNPFTSEPIVVLKNRESLRLPLPLDEEVWKLLERVSKRTLQRPTPVSASNLSKTSQPPIVFQLIPVATTVVGAAIGAIKTRLTGRGIWEEDGLISTMGIGGAIGFLVGGVAYYVCFEFHRRSQAK